MTILLVEQRVAEALESCDYGYVLETGRVALEGPHRALMADDRVRRAYLGMYAPGRRPSPRGRRRTISRG